MGLRASNGGVSCVGHDVGLTWYLGKEHSIKSRYIDGRYVEVRIQTKDRIIERDSKCNHDDRTIYSSNM